jgi:glycosyltransferase involved in cell wall biosynthesis
MERAHQLNVQDQVRIDFRFLSTEELLSKLSSCDIGVMAYDDDVTEGASGATRVMLRANLPLVLSRAPIFDEFRDVALTVGGKGLSLAREIYQLALSPERQRKILERQATFAALTDWNNVARMVFGYFDAY